jgi:hypothetical protein
VTPWQGFGLLALAGVLVATAVLHVAAPASCADADRARGEERYTQAAEGYTKILDDEPESECAQRGMDLTIYALCGRANRLEKANHTKDAEEAYSTVFALEPESRISGCAKAAAAATPGPGEPMRGPKGDPGPPGPPGKDGADGKDGTDGRDGRDAFCCTG